MAGAQRLSSAFQAGETAGVLLVHVNVDAARAFGMSRATFSSMPRLRGPDGVETAMGA
jgi:hypothetical protein